jgi:hypothetical protein
MAVKQTFRAMVKLGDGRRVKADVPVPTVVGVTQAALILRVPKSNVSRLRQQGRMPEPVPRPDGDTGAPVWLLEPVLVLAAELEAERQARRPADAA